MVIGECVKCGSVGDNLLSIDKQTKMNNKNEQQQQVPLLP